MAKKIDISDSGKQGKQNGDILSSFFTNNPNQKTMEVTPELSPLATIRVLGVGGGGCNAIQRMIDAKVEGVEFVAINTDTQALYHSTATKKINIGKSTTRGLGTGADPSLGKKSAEESSEEIKSALEGSDMIFITCGLGGGTGTGGSPIIAEIAKGLGILTVAVVTKPFSFEGARRKKQAIDGLNELKDRVDSIIMIPNDKILSIIDKKTPLLDAFAVVDDILRQGIQGISDLVTVHGMINVDFADVKAIMHDSGSALMGIGYGNGENRAAEAAKGAIDSPLLELTIDGAKGIIFNITGGSDLSMFEVDEAAKIITDAADPEANIIFGAVVNDSYAGEIKCTVIATGFDEEVQKSRTDSSSALKRLSSFPRHIGTPKMEEDLEIPAFMRKRLRGKEKQKPNPAKQKPALTPATHTTDNTLDKKENA